MAEGMELFEVEAPKRWPLEEARAAAEALADELEEYCERVSIGGSIRRQRPDVHDIDIVIIPGEGVSLQPFFERHRISPKGGEKTLKFRWKGIPVDLYIATVWTWPTIVLIRTGSKEHNIMMCHRAWDYGMKLHADGRGLEDNNGEPLFCSAERNIFEALRLPYREPWEREV